jgi:hypothetical protein
MTQCYIQGPDGACPNPACPCLNLTDFGRRFPTSGPVQSMGLLALEAMASHNVMAGGKVVAAQVPEAFLEIMERYSRDENTQVGLVGNPSG